VGDGAIDDAMVVAERDIAHRPDGDGIVDDHGALFDGAEAENADVWLADDRQAKKSAEDAGIGDGEGALLHFLGLEFLGAGALAEIGNAALQAEEIQVSGVLEDGTISPQSRATAIPTLMFRW